MLLVERIVETTDGGMVCLGRIPADGPLAAGSDVASTFLGLELAAQTAAVFEALRRDPAVDEKPADEKPADEKPRIGYLASIRTARFEVSDLPVGQALRATIRALGRVPPLAMYEVMVQLDSNDTPLLMATLSTYLTDQTST